MSSPVPNPDAASGPVRDPEMLHPKVYAELRAIAAGRMGGQAAGHTLQPTALVHEAWLRLSGKDSEWRDHRHFVAVAATAMRQILIDHARRKTAVRHGGGQIRVDTRSFHAIAKPDQDEQLLLLDEAIQALEKADPIRARVVVDRFFGGLSHEEIAENLDIGKRSVDRHWAAAKVWLLRWIEQHADSQP